MSQNYVHELNIMIDNYILGEILVETLYDYVVERDERIQYVKSFIHSHLQNPYILLLLSYIHLVGINGAYKNRKKAYNICKDALHYKCHDAHRIMRKIIDAAHIEMHIMISPQLSLGAYFAYDEWY